LGLRLDLGKVQFIAVKLSNFRSMRLFWGLLVEIA